MAEETFPTSKSPLTIVTDHILPAKMPLIDKAVCLMFAIGCGYHEGEIVVGDAEVQHIADAFADDIDTVGVRAVIWQRMGRHFAIWSEEEAAARSVAVGTSARGTGRRGFSASFALKVFAQDNYHCVACGSPDDLTVDHKTPIARGGTDDFENLQTLCRSCNSRKGAR